MYNIPRRPVISNNGFYTENTSAFLDHQLKSIARQVKSCIKDTNNFLKKCRDLPDLSIIYLSVTCTIDAVGLYPSIPNKEVLRFSRNALEKRYNKNAFTDTLFEPAELVLQNTTFEFNERYLKPI